MSNYPDGMTRAHWAYFDDFHSFYCENYTHYKCRECNYIWSKEQESHVPINQCPDCNNPCNPRYDDCVCENYDLG